MNQYKFSRAYVDNHSSRYGMFMLLAILTLFLVPKIALSEEISTAPNQSYTPQQVINIVVESLQNNSSDDKGIATVFRFASPGNKTATGPLSRFTQMIKRGFPEMLNHAGVRYDAIEITGDTAVQAVWLLTQSGAELGYAFQLRKQLGGTHDGMWMTEAVIPLGKNKNGGIRI
jgi:hypothetical protein